jgi:outer membrane protein OmpA-like peptidoglycan-associated protein
MIWATISTISLLSVLITAQPECDSTLWRVYPDNQRYFHQYADVTAINIPKPQLPEIPRGNTSPPIVVKTPKPEPVKSTLESSFTQGLKQFVNQQQQKEAKIVITNPTPPLPVRQEVVQAFRKEIVIEYSTNIFHLTASQKKKITSHLERYRQAAKIRIDSYADMVGSAQYNKLLTDQRAKEVEGVLITLGIDQNKISARGLGQTNILPSGQNSRRTEIWLLKK